MSRTIRAAVARTGQPLVIETCELDDPREREVVVELEACGICHTDLSAHAGHYGTPLPAVLGHEGVGRVIARGPGCESLAIGQRVIMSFGACGACPSCREQLPGYCRHAVEFNCLGRRLDRSSPITCAGEPVTGHFFGQSSFASFAVASITNAVAIADDLPAELMAPLACGVQTGAGAIVNVLDPRPDDVVAIFGCGTVGLAAVMAARIVGCRRIVAVDLRSDRLALARELGAHETIDNTTDDLHERLRELGGVDRAFDNTGNIAVIEAALAALRPRGQLVLAGVSPRRATIAVDANRLMAAGRAVRGTIEGDADPPSFIPKLIDWYRAGELQLHRLVTRYPFEQIAEAAAAMQAGRVIKPVLTMET